MKTDKRRERMLALFGDDPTLVEAYEKAKPPPPLSDEDKVKQSDAMLEAEAVMHRYWNPDKYTDKMCRECGQIFATNRPQHVSLCSVDCMKKSLEAIGIDWDPLRSLESRYRRMRMLPELTVPSAALEQIQSLESQADDSQPLLSEGGQDTQASFA